MEIIEIGKYYEVRRSDKDRHQDDKKGTYQAFGDGGECSGSAFIQDSWSSSPGRHLSVDVSESSDRSLGLVLSLARIRLSDDLIHSRIIFGLFSDAQVDDTHIAVRVVNGLVTLNGTVDDRCQKSRAEKIAANENGVTMVRNLLMVASGCISGDGAD